MKAKILLLFSCLLLSVGVFASERVVWSGNQPISWNQEMYTGVTQLLVKNFNDLQQDEVIKLYVTPRIAAGDVQDQLKHITSSWSWTDITGLTVNNGVIRYTPSSSIATDIVERGLIITGQGYDLTMITIASANGEVTLAKYDTVAVQRAHGHIYFDTRDELSTMLNSAVYQGYTIKAYTEPITDTPTYSQVAYKAGTGWTWTYVDAKVSNNVIAYTPQTAEVAKWIRDRGFVFRGKDYAINRIAVQTTQKFDIWEGDSAVNWWPGVIDVKEYINQIAVGDSVIVTAYSNDNATYSQALVGWSSGHWQLVYDKNNHSPHTRGFVINDTTYEKIVENNAFRVSGSQLHVTKVTIKKANYAQTETTVWTAKGKVISWNQDVYVGEQFDTKPVWNEPAILDLSLVEAGDILTFHVTAGVNNPQYRVDYKVGNEWTWTELTEDLSTAKAPTVEGAKGVITLTVPEGKASEIANSGLVFRGQGYNIDFITRTIPASNLTLNDNVDESAKLSRLQALDGPANITINRTIYKDGYYNTLCLPFDVPTLAGTPLEGATVRAFESAEVIDNVVYVTINDVRSLSAGVPYLVRFEAGEDIDAMTFNDVTVTATTGGVTESTAMNFNGILQPTELDASENLLFLGENNTLYWPEIAANLNGFRAYFNVNSIPGAPARGMRACLQEGAKPMPTSIDVITTENNATKCIYNGQLIIIKDGIQYNMLGQRQ